MRRNVFIGLVCLAGLAVLPGCGKSSQQRIEALQSAVTIVQEQSQKLDVQITALTAAMEQARTLLADPNLTGDTIRKIREDVADLEAKLAAAKPVKQMVDQKLAAYKLALDQAVATGAVDAKTEAELYGSGITMIGQTLPPPWNVYVSLVGGLIATVGGAIAGAIAKGRKAKQEAEATAQKNDAALVGIVGSVSALLKDQSIVADPEKAKDVLAREQVKVPEAAAAVRSVLDGQKRAAA